MRGYSLPNFRRIKMKKMPMQNMKSMIGPVAKEAMTKSDSKRKKFNSGFMKKKTMPGSGMNKLFNAMK